MLDGKASLPADRAAQEALLHKAMVGVYERAKTEANYHATRFIQLVADHGGLQAARMLIMSPTPSDGFVALWEARRLDLTVEALVLDQKWSQLFSEAELRSARQRLSEYGLSP